MFIAYINVTQEDMTPWDNTNHIRMCLHIWETDSNTREMVRFVNKNPLYDSFTDTMMDADFEAQVSTSDENLDDPLFFCSRRHDWKGLNKEVTSFNIKDLEALESQNPDMKNTDTYKKLKTDLDFQAKSGSYWIGS